MTYSNYHFKKAIKRQSQLSQESEHYKFGLLVADDSNYYYRYKEKFGVPIGGSIEWSDFLDGKYDATKINQHNKLVENNIPEFINKLNELCEKYNIELISSDGYCDIIGLYNGIEFELSWTGLN